MVANHEGVGDLFTDLHTSLVKRQAVSTARTVAERYWGIIPHKFQLDFWDICDSSKSYNAIIIPGPRDHSKTTSGLVLITKRILNNPNYRVLIAQKSREQARKSVRILKDFFEINTHVKGDFGDLVGNPWEADRFYLKRPDTRIKDPTVEGIGVMGTITGGHFDFLFVDDILDDVNAKTELTRGRVADWFRGTLMGLAEPQTQIVVVLTRKHYHDLYGELLENPFFYHPACRVQSYGHHNSCGYRAIVKEPKKIEPLFDENGVVTDFKIDGDYEVLWPEKRPLKWLLEQKFRYGETYFNREYQNDPSGMEGVFFLDKWLQYWVRPDEWTEEHEEGPYIEVPPADELRFFLAVDPAISQKTDSDYFAMVTFGMDREQRIYVYETFQARLDFPAQVKLITNTANSAHPVAIYIESTAYQDALRQQTQAMTGMNVVAVKTARDKQTRAVAIAPTLENGRVYVREDNEEFLNQYRQFPSGKHDDIIDAFMLGLQELTAKHVGTFDFAFYLPGGIEYDPEQYRQRKSGYHRF